MTKKFPLVHRCFAVPAWPSNFFHLTADTSLLHLVSHSKAILLLFVDCFLFLFTKFALRLGSTFNLEVYISPRHLIFLSIFVCCRWSKFGLELSFLLLFLLCSISWVLHWHCLNMFLWFLFLISEHIIVCHSPFMPENQWFARFAWFLVDLKGCRQEGSLTVLALYQCFSVPLLSCLHVHRYHQVGLTLICLRFDSTIKHAHLLWLKSWQKLIRQLTSSKCAGG